jgi:SAM-dependent methyltransferase
MTADDRPDQFYTGLVATAYGSLRGSPAPAEPYERFVRRYGEPALELGCGHGEPMLELVARGLDVTGVDSSADMLQLCADAAERRGLTVNLVQQRMEALQLDRRFASIFIAGATFQLVIDPDAAQETLRRIAAHLTDEGRAMIPLFTPTPIKPSLLGVWTEDTVSGEETLAVQSVSQTYRAEQRRVDTVLRYRRGPADAPLEIVDRQWSLCWYEAGEFETLAEQAGLRVDRTLDHGAFGRSMIVARTGP